MQCGYLHHVTEFVQIILLIPDHPDPTIHLGYDFVPTQHRRELFCQPVAKKCKNLSLSDDETVPFLVDSSNLTSPSPTIPPKNASSPLFSLTSEHSYY